MHVAELRPRVPGPRRASLCCSWTRPADRERQGPRTTPSWTTRRRSPSCDRGEMLRAVATAGAQVREALLRRRAGAARRRSPRTTVRAPSSWSAWAARASRPTSPRPCAGATCPVPVVPHRGLPAARLGGSDGPRRSRCPARAPPRRRCRRPTRPCAAARASSRWAPPARRSRPAPTAAAPCTSGSTRTAGCRGPTSGASRCRCCSSSTRSGSPTSPGTCSPGPRTSWTAIAERCGPGVDTLENPAKTLALAAGRLAAVRLGSERRRERGRGPHGRRSWPRTRSTPAIAGALTEVHHNQVVVMAGIFGSLGGEVAEDDIFRDRVDDGPGWPRMRLLVLRDTDELPQVAARAEASHLVAEQYGVPSSELQRRGRAPADPPGEPGRAVGLRQRLPRPAAGHRPHAHRADRGAQGHDGPRGERRPMSASGGTRAIVAALVANLGIAVTKFVAFLLTQSSSMLAESIHSLADSGNQVLLLVGGRRAQRAATPEHPFGYGRERYIYAFIVVGRAVQRRWPLRAVRGLAQAAAPGAHRLVAVGADRRPASSPSAWSPSRSAPRSRSPNEVRGVAGLDGVRPPGQGARAAGRPARGLRGADRPGAGAARRRPDAAHRRRHVGRRRAPSRSACCWSSWPSCSPSRPRACCWARARPPTRSAGSRRRSWPTRRCERVIHMKTLHLGPEELLVAAKIAVAPDDSATEVAPSDRRRRGAGSGRPSRSRGSSTSSPTSTASTRRPARDPTATPRRRPPDLRERSRRAGVARPRSACLQRSRSFGIAAARGRIGAGVSASLMGGPEGPRRARSASRTPYATSSDVGAPVGAGRRQMPAQRPGRPPTRSPVRSNPNEHHPEAWRLQGRRPVAGRVRPQRDPPRRARDARPDGAARGVRRAASRSTARASPARCT